MQLEASTAGMLVCLWWRRLDCWCDCVSAACRAFKEMQLEAAAQLRATTRKDDAVVVKKYEVRR